MTATVDSTGSTDSTGADATNPDLSTSESGDIIPTLRTQIDDLDAAIIRLVTERSRVSKRVQAARINSGGARIELGREREIIASYRTALGTEGPQLAEAVLRAGRGQL